MIRVMVVDDEALVRSGFQLILRAAIDIDVVATASGADAIAEMNRHHPDVVLLDIRMPDVDGLTILRQIRAQPEPPTVAMLTTFDADEYIAAALRCGAAGFILKDTDPEHLAHLVRTLAEGAVVLSPTVTQTVITGYLDSGGSHSAATQVAHLTDRERDVLILIGDGLSNADIGARLYLSGGTVKDHVSAILAKLNVTSRVQAALLAERAGLLQQKQQQQNAGPLPPALPDTPHGPLGAHDRVDSLGDSIADGPNTHPCDQLSPAAPPVTRLA